MQRHAWAQPQELPSVLRELFNLIPPEGTPWSEGKRELWLDAMRASFHLFYPEPRRWRIRTELDLIARRAGDDSGR